MRHTIDKTNPKRQFAFDLYITLLKTAAKGDQTDDKTIPHINEDTSQILLGTYIYESQSFPTSFDIYDAMINDKIDGIHFISNEFVSIGDYEFFQMTLSIRKYNKKTDTTRIVMYNAGNIREVTP